MRTLFQDFRIGPRMLRQNPGFATLAALTLAIGRGAKQPFSGLRMPCFSVRFPTRMPNGSRFFGRTINPRE